MTIDYKHPTRTTHTPPKLDLRKSRGHLRAEFFGTSTDAQRDTRRQILANAVCGVGTDMERVCAREANAMGRIAYAYGNGVRDTLMVVLGYHHPLIEQLLSVVWSFSDEYAWHVYVGETQHGGSRTGYASAFDAALAARGVVIPRHSYAA